MVVKTLKNQLFLNWNHAICPTRAVDLLQKSQQENYLKTADWKRARKLAKATQIRVYVVNDLQSPVLQINHRRGHPRSHKQKVKLSNKQNIHDLIKLYLVEITG